MDDKEIKGRAEAEVNRITELLIDAGISERRIKLLNPVIVNTAWMKAKLDDAREAVKNSQIVITYDNGGGQKGIRENPLFKGYESLWKAYMQGMSKIVECLPQEEIKQEAERVETTKSVLELVRGKHKKEA